jgi:hypothetical protein
VGHRRLRRLGSEAVDDGLQPGDLLACSTAFLAIRSSSLARAVRYWVYGALVLDQLTHGFLGRAIEMQHTRDRLVEQDRCRG